MSGIQLERAGTVAQRLGRGRSTIHSDVREGLMPPPIRLGLRWSAWPSDEVDAIARARIAELSDDELRVLVKGLVAARRNRIAGLGDDDPVRRHVSIEG